MKKYMVMMACTLVTISLFAEVNDNAYYIARPQKGSRCCGDAASQLSEYQSWLQRAPVNNTSDLVRERVENALTRAEAAMR